MKTAIRLAMIAAIASLLSGCATNTADSFFPEGHAAKARYTRTGKFSSTTVEADNFTKTAQKVTADKLRLNHSNAWMPNLELVIEGYERVRNADESDKNRK